MTRNGAIQKTFVLFLILVVGGAISWGSNSTFLGSVAGWTFLAIAGFALGLITSFVPRVSPFTSPVYALVEGMLIGAISAVYNSFYNGIVIQAIMITVAIFLITLIFYAAKIIKVTNRFRNGVIIATLSVCLIYFADFILSAFGLRVPFLNDSGIIGIIINVVIIIIAGLNFMLDFDFIDRAAGMGVPKYMEWYMGFSIMVTFIWLYLEVLRLLSLLQGSSRR
jgi:uncharacterized YccA/Bax inhibitor family protein